MTRHVPGRRLAGAVGGVIALAMLTPVGISQAATGHLQSPRSIVPHAAMPQVQPATGTPHFPATTPTTEQVRQLVQCGNTMYAVGTFSVVEQGTNTFTRNNAFSFKATAPFTITSWNPNVNGTVNSIAFNAGHCADAYIGGIFTKVRGRSASRIAEVSTAGAGGAGRQLQAQRQQAGRDHRELPEPRSWSAGSSPRSTGATSSPT